MSLSIRAIHQIEMTSQCNLRCKYCCHPKMPRPKIHMSDEHYRKSLDWVKHFQSKRPHPELNLAGIGESTLHPEFVRNVFLAREAVGRYVNLVLATNGLLMTDELAKAIAPARPMVWVSLHRPEKAGPAVEALKHAGIFSGVSSDPSTAAVDWAGQVKWHVSAAKGRPCPWMASLMVMVMADGRVTRCCFDSDGSGVIAHINDDLSAHGTSPFGLCATCHLSADAFPKLQEAAA
jgi:hypothetical protein